MIPYAKRSFARLLITLLIASSVLASAAPHPVHAAYQAPENIRVAFFLNLSSFKSITPVATLQSSGGLNLSWNESANSLPLATAPAGQAVRFGMDGYRALLAETEDYSAAIAVLKKVQASSNAAFVTQLSKSGRTVYQVSEGAYASASEASAALTKWTKAGVASGVQSSTAARIAGPLALEAGPYASLAEAQAAADQFGGAGLDAFAALKPQNGALSYIVRVGQEKDAASAAALQQSAMAAAGGANVRIPGVNEPYVTLRNDMTYNGSAKVAVPLYAIPVGGGAVLRADPAGEGGIQLIERSKRTYRGSMEISVLNQALAVVNDVNLEQYLYSVVGTEVGSGWPLEAQKAQAVAARTYALSVGTRYQIAHVVDTTLIQAYYGISSENANSTAGVNETAGQVMTIGGKPISAVFSSNAGGVTADTKSEIWGGDNSFLASNVTSPDEGPQKSKLDWYYVALPSGQVGYIRSDLVSDSGQTHVSGAKYLKVSGEGTAVRSRPQVVSTIEPIARVGAGTLVVELDKVPEYTVYSWTEAPMTSEQLLTALNKRAKTPINAPLVTLEVSKRGPSGRVTEVKANGTVVDVGVPDNLRGAFGGLMSTLFSIEETGRYTIINGDGAKREVPERSGTLQAIGSDGQVRSIQDPNLFIMDGNGSLRAATTSPSFVISGKGNGHGGGMSQWGARGLAEQGYDYQYILQYYYKNVTIEKDA
ncbi:SpoIID/LytB domain-containing protein [Cohnella cholangitidis]|uniref:SpoIID/LytB domain-containing protein n=1 Tax=Cohnella cholangitidis TaxID=2598458 RepID=A0A7G5C3P6_9BACL|nr:SpoIID/LytB domain-containing protein [Cohnella cholangitidis]QMV43830.1 SpoIID/LytB domain-containing protein [Cohnella cholangitidis]